MGGRPSRTGFGLQAARQNAETGKSIVESWTAKVLKDMSDARGMALRLKGIGYSSEWGPRCRRTRRVSHTGVGGAACESPERAGCLGVPCGLRLCQTLSKTADEFEALYEKLAAMRKQGTELTADEANATVQPGPLLAGARAVFQTHVAASTHCTDTLSHVLACSLSRLIPACANLGRRL